MNRLRSIGVKKVWSFLTAFIWIPLLFVLCTIMFSLVAVFKFIVALMILVFEWDAGKFRVLGEDIVETIQTL